MADYPNSQPSFTTKNPNDLVASVDYNKIHEELSAALTEFGLVPSGSESSVASRISQAETDIAANTSAIANAGNLKSITIGTIARSTYSGYTFTPTDDTTPQITEGAQIATLSVTPVSATSTLVFYFDVKLFAGGTSGFVIALHKSGQNDAIQSFLSRSTFSPSGDSDHHGTRFATVGSHGTSALTYSLRASYIGANNTINVNTDGGANRYNLTTAPFICLEIEV